uniref:Flavin-containing monooxygenase n=1 Tax=Zea mays TaxID=4577 RepID=A0A804LN40_MAIZE
PTSQTPHGSPVSAARSTSLHAVGFPPPRRRRRGRGGPGCRPRATPRGPCARRLRARRRRWGHLALHASRHVLRPARRRGDAFQPLRIAPHQPATRDHGLPRLPLRRWRRGLPRPPPVSRARGGAPLPGGVRAPVRPAPARPLRDGGRWAVTSRKLGDKGSGEEEFYDAVVVCNGHYTEPRLAVIPGVDAWPGKQMHSHNYRVPEPFLDQVVIIIGASASAVDISRDIASMAEEVHIADRSAPASTCNKQPGYDNLWLHSMIDHAQEDGTVVFQDGSSIKADVIMHCTGYLYDFPFLGDDSTITVDDNRVDPLYKHIFPPEVAPHLSFIGLPWKVIPFPLFELQSKWVARVLSGRINLPSEDRMMEDVKAFYLKLEAHGWPKRYTHNFANYQFEYDDWLAEQCGHPPVEEWRKQMYAVTSMNKAARPESYRDEWDDEHLVAEANEYFKKFL